MRVENEVRVLPLHGGKIPQEKILLVDKRGNPLLVERPPCLGFIPPSERVKQSA